MSKDKGERVQEAVKYSELVSAGMGSGVAPTICAGHLVDLAREVVSLRDQLAKALADKLTRPNELPPETTDLPDDQSGCGTTPSNP